MSSVSFELVSLLLPGDDRVGRLAFVNGQLAAIFVRLDDATHPEPDRGRWHLEFSVESFARRPHPAPFQTLADASLWLQRLAAGRAANDELGDDGSACEIRPVSKRPGGSSR